MIEFGFDGALQFSSGLAEALHAAGADVGVPASDDASLQADRRTAGCGADSASPEGYPLQPPQQIEAAWATCERATG